MRDKVTWGDLEMGRVDLLTKFGRGFAWQNATIPIIRRTNCWTASITRYFKAACAEKFLWEPPRPHLFPLHKLLSWRLFEQTFLSVMRCYLLVPWLFLSGRSPWAKHFRWGEETSIELFHIVLHTGQRSDAWLCLLWRGFHAVVTKEKDKLPVN